ncbi:NADH-quinone oxidoreductase subunit J family protein [Tuwongella immobilis]|uniref:NADH-quinone oxidoreductase subunit J n=1 Tax=Tuwongella immobilis TaxID=692036 RepID=A0A6C2YH95_9BACT|nr:NADH-quinone oxidoreductase subunit J [Tuwongella immobilis]VIP00900.1 nadh-ubiquinone plastoquinone oxidoreductase chain 6 : NADH-ubiquinone/plastoquinone oxidoreductase chain 6 OS=Planctomyces limnophilus (strain ATCC 43296 / DSM 3776 / IFAM 1008 / 290) GN=Plim_3866 PE=3 SV=1: Oxidored_q3 [Tuwongella immobilis]VTR97218.1 nadh-ubiquinone plastoquinone oxidoreductase chain 6 : NADH-ubiquinone/plastoquinone oxidoreductase chain 6 OS=Planctomyces limnophilus (strain ATCC 43296 / DSM 3776 / IFAM 
MNGPLLLPITLGFLSIFTLLPRTRLGSPIPGALLGLAALVSLGAYLLGTTTGRPLVTVEELLFYAFAGKAILFAGLMIVQRNPARSAIAFAVVILSVCGLFLLQGAPFLFAATLIIYAGAIIVTFLFVLMLSAQSGYSFSDANDRSREPFLASLVGFVLLGVLLVVLQRAYDQRSLDRLLLLANNASRATTADELQAVIPTPVAYLESLRREVDLIQMPVEKGTDDDLRSKFDMLQAAIESLKQTLQSPPDAAQWESKVQQPLVELTKLGRDVQRSVNDPLIRNQKMLESTKTVVSSGYGASLPASPSGLRELPAANVPALGRTLFSDHLLTVELAGTLLLVATIGAILIASDRPLRNPV